MGGTLSFGVFWKTSGVIVYSVLMVKHVEYGAEDICYDFILSQWG
jgi:uncharacterized membrane protein